MSNPDRADGQAGDKQDTNRKCGPRPEIVKGRPGYASYSLAALRERIQHQLEEELSDRDDILLDEPDEAARRALVRDAGNYVLAAESVPLTLAEKNALFDEVHSNVFGFGPLDHLLDDESITELTIDGHESVHIRRRMGQPEQAPSHFEDEKHLIAIIDRIVTGAGGQLLEDEYFLEMGLVMRQRPARISLICPPLSPLLHADIRLHPRTAATLDDLAARGGLSAVDRQLLQAIAESRHGALIVGEVAAGKTTLLQALLPHLPDLASCWLVERAAELRPPVGFNVRRAIPRSADHPALSFASQIAEALAEAPETLLLDELRGDESVEVWGALAADDGPRCLFVLRSSPDPDRLRNAFSILIRKGQPSIPQEAINRALLERVPFVIMTHIDQSGLHVSGISEWAPDPESGDVRPLAISRAGVLTGGRPCHALEVPEDFWA